MARCNCPQECVECGEGKCDCRCPDGPHYVKRAATMTAPDSRDSVERVVAEMRTHVKRNGVFAAGGITEQWADRLQALARGPQQADSLVNLADSLVTQAGKDELLGRLDLMADHGWRAPREAAVRIRALEVEVARLTAAEQESFQKFVDTNEQRIELLADARQLAASVHGAFGALGSDPPEPILKLANRYFLMKRRGRRSAALNGDQN